MLMMLITACTSKKKTFCVFIAQDQCARHHYSFSRTCTYIYIYNRNSDRRFSLSLSHVNLYVATQSFNKMNVYMFTIYNITFRSTSFDTLSSPICWTTNRKRKKKRSQHIKANDPLDVSFLFEIWHQDEINSSSILFELITNHTWTYTENSHWK